MDTLRRKQQIPSPSFSGRQKKAIRFGQATVCLAFTYEQYVIAKKAYDSRKENYEKELKCCQEYNEERISHLEEWYEEEFEDTAAENRPDKEDWITKKRESLLHQVPTKVSFYAESRSAIRVTERNFLDQIARFLDEMGEKNVI